MKRKISLLALLVVLSGMVFTGCGDSSTPSTPPAGTNAAPPTTPAPTNR